MQDRSGPTYQLRLLVSQARATELDEWLQEHVRDSLQKPGIVDCNAFSAAVEGSAKVGRVCQYEVDNDDALNEYLDTAAANVEADLVQRFGADIEFSDHVLREDTSHELPPGESPNCLNCGYHLRGQYCGQCGQRSRSRLISLWELVTDAFGDLFELDSRIWKTLFPLVFRPGLLTHDYLQGRRARFMPPFRMYLVMSLLFFVVAFFNPREELSLFFEPPAVEETEETDADEATDEDSETDADGQTGNQLHGPVFVFSDDEDGSGEIEDEDDCDEIEPSDLEGMPEFLARRMTPERLTQVCHKLFEDKGKSLIEKVIGNVPTALILLLPIMALVLKALYPLSRRYYVEHLLFFVHLHAFYFLLLTFEILFLRAAAAFAFPDPVIALVAIPAGLYAPVYLFVAMRRVYGQGRIVTFLKYILLFVAYFTGFLSIMTLTFLLAAFSM